MGTKSGKSKVLPVVLGFVAVSLVVGIFSPGEEEVSSTNPESFATVESVEMETAEPEVAESDPVETTGLAKEETAEAVPVFASSDIPTYDGQAYVAVNGNVPYFADSEKVTTAFENYSDLDGLGRCGVAYANICLEIMPTEEYGSIGSVKPSGWQSVKYDCVDGNYLYNRCHLIGFQLAGENANEKNLITGTRYLNIEGMLPFENIVADYVKETGNHVLYRVTPVFAGDHLIADGVLMEAESVEDDGILFCVFCYNVQPGVGINYADGSSWLDGTVVTESEPAGTAESAEPADTTEASEAAEPAESSEPGNVSGEEEGAYVVNGRNGKIHMNGECAATGNGDNAMSDPVYFATYEEAESYSISIAPKLEKRKCGNCW